MNKPLSKDDAESLRLGREIVRMIHDLGTAPTGEVAYSRRKFTFPGGAVDLFLVRGTRLADAFEAAATAQYDVETAIPRSQVN